MATRLFSVVVDSHDQRTLGRWWADALGWQVIYEDPEETEIAPAEGARFSLSFVPVPDTKTTKNRIHLDLGSDSDEHQHQLVDRLLGAGAARADIGQADTPWVVLADPEGNELCVLEPRPRHAGHALASIVVDCVDVNREADFWREAIGWDDSPDDLPPIVRALRNPSGALPDLDFVTVPEAKSVKDRLHIDIAPGCDDDQAAEVERLVAAGAAHADVGQGPDVTWVVLSDPEGHEFCVLSPRD